MQRNSLKEKNVLKNWKQHIAVILMLTILVTLIPVGTVQAKSKKISKLGAKDFLYTSNGKKEDAIKDLKSVDQGDGAYWLFNKIIDTKNIKGNVKSFKTNRNVKIGSTESYVKKKYGKTSKVKVKQNEKLYKCIKYNDCGRNTSAWKNYLEYIYKKGSDKYKLRFYLDKKNKVTAIAYIRNLEKFYNYPNKELKAGLKFQAPKGKKVTTKTINGKKVYMVPKGTKIKYNEQGRFYFSLDIYGVYGQVIGGYDGDNFGGENDLETIAMGEYIYHNGKQVNMKKLGKHLYFVLKCIPVRPWNPETQQSGNPKKAPSIYYFKFK